jgi:chromosome partitioning protein
LPRTFINNKVEREGVPYRRKVRTNNMRRIAIINQKGGVGKTTTTVNLGSKLAREGKKVVLLDLDPQAHLTMHFGHEPNPEKPNIYKLLTGDLSLEQILQPAIDNMLIGDANIDLAAAEVELASVVGREVILRDAIMEYSKPCDYVLMDCPPSLGVLTINALCAADEVFITLQPHFLALQGMGKLLETINLVAKRINRDLKVTGVVLCLFEKGTKLANEVVEDMESFFEQAKSQHTPWSDVTVFKTRIRRNIKLAEAPSYGQDIFAYAPDSNGAEDYSNLCAEVLAMEGNGEQSEADGSKYHAQSNIPGETTDKTSAEDTIGSVSGSSSDADPPSEAGADTGSAGQG